MNDNVKFYPKQLQTQVRVGIFAVVILLILLFSYTWLMDSVSTKKQVELKVLFNDVQGLEVGDKVSFRGMEAGRVRSVQAGKDGILVVSRVDASLMVPSDSRFIIQDSSLMGGKQLAIIPPPISPNSNNALDYKRTYQGEQSITLLGVVSQAQDLLVLLNEVVESFSAKGGIAERSKTLLGNTDSTVKKIDQLGTELASDLTLTIKSIKSSADQIDAMLAANRSNLDLIIRKSPQTVEEIASTMDSLQALSTRLNTVANNLSLGKGSAGKLLTNDELHNKLTETVNNLDDLIKDIKANPKKYVKISLF